MKEAHHKMIQADEAKKHAQNLLVKAHELEEKTKHADSLAEELHKQAI